MERNQEDDKKSSLLANSETHTDKTPLLDDSEGEDTEQTPLLEQSTAWTKEQEAKRQREAKKWTRIVITVIIVFLVATVLTLALLPWDNISSENNVERYKTAAVSSDSKECSFIGRDILRKGGSSVDSAIATSLCLGLHSMQSSGIGGGSFMLIYESPRNGSDKEIAALDFREVAPLAATPELYNYSGSYGAGNLSIGVPGEISGYWEAWQRFGRLPWKELFQPTISLCRNGYVIGEFLAGEILSWSRRSFPDECSGNSSIRELLFKEDGSVYKAGDTLKNPKLADTLQQIADSDGCEFYTGNVSLSIIQDLTEIGSPITADELASYTPIWRDPIKFNISNTQLYGFPAPSGGPIVNLILNILEGYPSDDQVLIHHRIAEALKFGFATRTRFGDPDFVNVTEAMSNATSKEFAAYVRNRIDDDRTHNVSYYNPASEVKQDGGTSHISVLAPDGAAVALTSTINGGFGSKCRGSRTGILFNNEMEDFSNPANPVRFHSANVIAGGKRPLSSMSPLLIFDSNHDVAAVIGGSGGTKIIAGVGQVAYAHLLLKQPIEQAVEQPRLHHTLQPNLLYYEAPLPKDIVNGLKQKGHLMRTSSIGVTNSIERTCYDGGPPFCITAVSDERKGGIPGGY